MLLHLGTIERGFFPLGTELVLKIDLDFLNLMVTDFASIICMVFLCSEPVSDLEHKLSSELDALKNVSVIL